MVPGVGNARVVSNKPGAGNSAPGFSKKKPMQTATKPARLDISTPAGQKAVSDAYYSGNAIEPTSVGQFLKTGVSNTYYGRYPLVCDYEEYTYLIVGGAMLCVSGSLNNGSVLPGRCKHSIRAYRTGKKPRKGLTYGGSQQYGGVLLKAPKGKKQKYLLIANGDDGATSVGDSARRAKSSYCTVSLECLRRFYGDKATLRQVVRMLASGRLQLQQYTGDHTIKLTATERKAIGQWHRDCYTARRNKKPQPNMPIKAPVGYTFAGQHQWHRSSSVVLHDKRKGFSILIGQDEGSYFGVELAGKPKTVAGAFTDLMPPEVRSFKGTVRRQGEWFALPVKESDVPDVADCLMEAATLEEVSTPSGYGQIIQNLEERRTVSLGRDSDDSANHYVLSKQVRVSKDGTVYAHDATLSHSNGDHQDMVTAGWVKYLRNTAKRSYSVAGVD